jgi:glycosyltransferase involved in cell wall biosynthesis
MIMSQNPLKLLFTNDSLPLGGAERVLLQYLGHLDRKSFEVHLVTLTDQGVLMPKARTRADHYFCLNRRFGLDLTAILKLRKYMIEHEIALVHTSQWLDSLYVWLAGKGLKVKKIASIHGYHGYNYNWRHHVNLYVLKKYDCIIPVSQAVKLDLYKMGIPWGKMQVISNTYDATAFSIISQHAGRRPRGPFRLVMVGNFRWEKDQRTLVEAVYLMKAQGHNLVLDLVGKGNEDLFQDCLSLVKKLDLQSSVNFLGQQQVNGEFLSRYDMFVFSSLSETFGIALLEAMACGLPVLVSDIPPSMELIRHGKCGLYFETGNPSSCAEAINMIINNPQLQQVMGRRAKERAKDYHPEKIIRAMECLYREIISDSKGGNFGSN